MWPYERSVSGLPFKLSLCSTGLQHMHGRDWKAPQLSCCVHDWWGISVLTSRLWSDPFWAIFESSKWKVRFCGLLCCSGGNRHLCKVLASAPVYNQQIPAKDIRTSATVAIPETKWWRVFFVHSGCSILWTVIDYRLTTDWLYHSKNSTAWKRCPITWITCTCVSPWHVWGAHYTGSSYTSNKSTEV